MLRNIMDKLDKVIMNPKLEELEDKFFNKLGEMIANEPMPIPPTKAPEGTKEEPAEK